MHQLVLTLLAVFSSGLSVVVPLPRPAHAKDSALFRARALIKRCNMETIYADRFVLGERFETDNHTLPEPGPDDACLRGEPARKPHLWEFELESRNL